MWSVHYLILRGKKETKKKYLGKKRKEKITISSDQTPMV